MLPLVSIIIPIYNVEKYVIACLESVQQQTYTNIETILIDDKGTDKSMNVVNDFYNKSSSKPKIITHLKNLGLSLARNSGMKHASGEYIYFLDSDDIITKDCIEKLVNYALKYNSDIVVGQLICLEYTTQITKNIFPINIDKKNITEKDILASFSNGAWPVVAWNKLYRKAFIDDNHLQFESGLLHEDELWAFQCAYYAKNISFCQDISYYYIFHDKNIIFNKTVKNTDDLTLIATRIYHYYQQENNFRKKSLIRFYSLRFNEQLLRIIFQYIEDKKYFKQSYRKIRNITPFALYHIFNPSFSIEQRKLIFYTSLPVEIGYRLYKYRFTQKISSLF